MFLKMFFFICKSVFFNIYDTELDETACWYNCVFSVSACGEKQQHIRMLMTPFSQNVKSRI